MIDLLTKDELKYEKKKLFRSKFTFGAWNMDKPEFLIDKGKLLKKIEKSAPLDSDWVRYIYRKMNALNQHYEEKFWWTPQLTKFLSKNALRLMKERAKIAEHFGSSTKRPRNQREGTTSQWKGLDTTPSNVVRFTFLKQQLKSKEHPINQLIDEFHNWSEKKYYFLTESSVEQEDVDQVKDEIIRNTQQFIALMFLTTIKFYQLTMKDNENNRDILLEILTGLVVRKDLYLCISKTITYCKSAEIDILERKMSMEENVDFDKSEYIAGISDIFSFSGSRKYNKMLHMKSELPDTLYQDTESQLKEEKTSGKYAKWSKMIRKLADIENPSSKIQLLMRVTDQIKQEIDDYWEGISLDIDDKRIDADNMEKLMGYIIIKSGYQQIVVDLTMIDYFSGEHLDSWISGFIYVWISNSVQQIVRDSFLSDDKDFERKTPCFVNKKSQNEFTMMAKNEEELPPPDFTSSCKKLLPDACEEKDIDPFVIEDN